MTQHPLARVQTQQTLTRAATWLAILLPVFAWAPLTFPGYVIVHSGFVPIFNLNDLMGHLTDFWWAPTVGQPYDLWRAERALPYLLAVLPHLFGASLVTAVKIVFGLALVAGAIGVYAWARRHVGGWPALVASFLYVLLPVNLATIYVRGAFAEAVFLGLAPWLLYAAQRAVTSGKARWAILLAVLLAATLWTQAGLALWWSLICLLYILMARLWASPPALDLRQRGPSRQTVALLGWAGGWALGLLGLVPVIMRHGWVGETPVVFAEHFAYPHQFLAPAWGSGPSISGPYDTLTLQVGIVGFGLALCALVAPGLRSGEPRAHEARVDGPAGSLRPLMVLAALIVFGLVFLSSSLAAPLWGIFSAPSRTLTYPWQLLLLAGPWLALLAGMGALALAQLLGPTGVFDVPLHASLLALVLVGSYGFLIPQTTRVVPPGRPLAIFGDDEVALLRADVQGTHGPGNALTLSTEWQALRPLTEDYTVFFHALSSDGAMRGQHDSMPQAGAAPTSGWLPGVIVTDTMRLVLNSEAPAGPGYSYPIGLYLWQTGERLRNGDADRFVLQP